MQIGEKADIIIDAIVKLLREKGSVTVAIDGRCASGKTTLAAEIANRIGCNIFHMDDFFLPPSMRTEERLKAPGGNVDHERFLCEVLEPLKRGEGFSYRPYSCKTQTFCEEVYVHPNRVNLTEGAYSCHPSLVPYYDLLIFSDIAHEEQIKRLEVRNGKEGAKRFREIWIPLEEKYFEAFSVRESCHLYLK